MLNLNSVLSMLGKQPLAILGWLVASGLLVYQLTSKPRIVTETKLVDRVVEKEVEKKVFVDRWKTRVITKPDGTRIEENSGSKSKSSTDIKVVEKEVIKTQVITAQGPKYSLGVARSIFDQSLYSYKLSLGYRVIGDFWLTAGGDLTKDIVLGIRYEW